MEFAEKLKKYRLSNEEYGLICEKLGREPKDVEWALFSALWSEHCSYKSSKVHLRKLFNKGARVLQSFGENAGVLDLGEGEKIAFKMESHNHPSFIEPYQGAATGVGGILRDIFTMGARPIALANYLCFGEPTAPRMPSIVDGVVRGIGGYGNCVGVPTITGQVEFDSSYNQNVLVNAFAIGLFGPKDPICLSKASGVGNWVVYVGAKTGRDGVHGAAMASVSFTKEASLRPTVQIGDPFFEKLLIESCIEVMQAGLVVAIQDMGAAGLTSSSFEMAAKGEVGLKIHLDQVPLRDASMTPEDILLSESQERMLLICEPEKFSKIEDIFKHWGLDACKIGEVTSNKEVELIWKGQTLTKINPSALVDEAPVYERPYESWDKFREREANNVQFGERVMSVSETLKAKLKSPRGTSRSWVYGQYDQRVGGQTAKDASESVGVVRLPFSKRALGIVLGCRPSVMRRDAELGGMDSIVYPVLELAIKGFEAIGATDCLNFGNPTKTKVMSEFVASLRSMSRACELLKVPIISGNVSFYNETQDKNITSTPATGLVGFRRSIENIPSSQFQGNERIYWLNLRGAMSSGMIHEEANGRQDLFGDFDIEKWSSAILALPNLFSSAKVRSSRMVGKYGLAYALARMCTSVGANVEIGFISGIRGNHDLTIARHLFLEPFYEIIVGIEADFATEFENTISKLGIEFQVLGRAEGKRLQIRDGAKELLDISCSEIGSEYESGWREQVVS